MDPLQKTVEGVAAQFHEIFGGENRVVDRPEEIPQLAAQSYSEVEPYAQKAILESLLREGGHGGEFSLFQNDLVLKLCNELIGLKTKEAQRAVQSLFYFLEGKYGGELPSFVKLTGENIPEGDKRPSDIKTIFLFVNKNGHRLPVIIPEPMLEAYGDIDISVDGMIDSMAIIGNAGSKVTAGGREWKPKPKGDDFIVEKFGTKGLVLGAPYEPTFVQISPFTWPAPLRALFSDDLIPKLDYFFSGDFHSDIRLIQDKPMAFFRKESAAINFNNRKITLHQTPAKRLGELGFSEPPGTVRYFYYGERDAIDNDPAFQRGVDDIAEGIRFAEEGLGYQPVNVVEVHPVPYKYIGARHSQETVVVFSEESVMRENIGELRMAASHEVMHALDYQEKFYDEPEVIEYFDALSKAKDGLFDFIKESNFYNGWEIGHPSDSVREFLASFLHTLLDIDRLEIKLSNLPAGERDVMIEHYTVLVRMLAMSAKSDRARVFFELTQDRIDGIRRACNLISS